MATYVLCCIYKHLSLLNFNAIIYVPKFIAKARNSYSNTYFHVKPLNQTRQIPQQNVVKHCEQIKKGVILGSM